MKTNNTNSLSPPEIQKEYEDPWNILSIDLDSLKSNYRFLKSQLPKNAVFYTVLKSDAYGHGIREVGKTLAGVGCKHFAVESPSEGIALRNEDISGEILLMNPIPEWMAELAVRQDLSVSVIHQSILQPLEDAAKSLNKKCKIHLNVNVGLNRMGIAPSKLLKIAKQAHSKPHLKLEGLFAQPRDTVSAKNAFIRLKKIYGGLKAKGCAPKILHFNNSTTFLAQPDTIANGVRLGILIYGVLPPEQFKEKQTELPIKPAMKLETQLVQVRSLQKGSRLGYHSRDKIDRDSIIGTIAIGYYHGLDRKITRGGYVLLRGKKAHFLGSISMNASMVDITDVPEAKIGDKVTIIGKQNENQISINELAEQSETIAAELMTRFGKSIARTYESETETISTEITIKQKETDDIHIHYFQTEKELPNWINVYDIVNFLNNHLTPYDDPEEIIYTAVDYALSSDPQGKGFVLLATTGKKIIGAIISLQVDKIGIIPENIYVYICVHKNFRGKGLGTRLINEAIECTVGDIKMHVEKSNPAINLYKKLGFKNEYLEMRLLRGGSRKND